MTRFVPVISLLTIMFAMVAFAFPVYASHNGYRDHNDGRFPSCWIKATPNTVQSSGNRVTLSWDSSYADRAVITDIGEVSTDGSMSINVYSPKTYRMTVYNDDRSEDCETLVNVVGVNSHYNNYVNYYGQPHYTYPTYPTQYLSLTQIPYTGFDFGPLGNSIYWLTLFTIAFLAAYLLIYQSGMRALASIPVIDETIRAGKMQFATAKEIFARPAKKATPATTAQTLPVAPARSGSDAMRVVGGAQPHIVITRE